jgi:prefoldin subunit 5
MTSPDDDRPGLYEHWDGVEQRRNQPRMNTVCAEHQQTREHFQAIESNLGQINIALSKIDKDLIATISAGKVKSGVIAATVTIVLLFGGYWVSEFRELKSLVSRGMEMRVNNAARLDNVENDIKDIREDIKGWQKRWEDNEKFVHGTGVENHHLEKPK